jgi:hypothetical protein
LKYDLICILKKNLFITKIRRLIAICIYNKIFIFITQETRISSWVPVAHACTPSYLGGRDQEDPSSKQTQANSLQDPISKIPNTKRVDGVAQGVGQEFKPQYCKKVNKEKKNERN